MKKLLIGIAVTAGICLPVALSAIIWKQCEYTRDKSDVWKTKFDISFPNLENADGEPNSDGWYQTMYENFEGDSLPELWVCSPHKLRKTEYWCDKMVRVEDGFVKILAEYKTDHACDGECPSEGYFTGGIETDGGDGISNTLFSQAFGYFEARVKAPRCKGMWSAFWLQTQGVNRVGDKGVDGTEIDIYESSFFDTDRNKSGHALHYDGYGWRHRCRDVIVDAGTDLYEGFHTYALKWTPEEYVFYVDGVATWASDFGGVSAVPEYLRLTCEIRGDIVGPYGQKLGDFAPDDGTSAEFIIDYVKVYQNTNYEEYIQAHDIAD